MDNFLTAVRSSELPSVAVQDVAASFYIHSFMLSRWHKQAREGVIMTKGAAHDKAGTVAGFRYSRAMKNANITWTVKRLDAYIANPQKVVPGNLMPFSGLPEAKERAELVAYLETLK